MSTEIANTTASIEAMLIDVQREERMFELAQRKANVYAKSGIVPRQFANNIGAVMIAMNIAARMGTDPLQVMQNLYIVHGNPGWSASYLIGCFNSSGRFGPIHYRFNAERTGCVAYAKELATGDTIEGTEVTIAMAKAEGWWGKAGSKWPSMTEQMLCYRAAAFMIRANAPEIGLGLPVHNELGDDSRTVEGRARPVTTTSNAMERLAMATPSISKPADQVPPSEPAKDPEPKQEAKPDPKPEPPAKKPAEKSKKSAEAKQGDLLTDDDAASRRDEIVDGYGAKIDAIDDKTDLGQLITMIDRDDRLSDDDKKPLRDDATAKFNAMK